VNQFFKAPRKSLGDLKADVAAKLIASTADLALVLDNKGVIRDIAYDGEELAKEECEAWVGRPWVETVTLESRPKIDELIKSAIESAAPRRRQVNHPSLRGDLPIQYSAITVGEEGRIIAMGRNLRSVAVLQQRLVDTQQSMEREYARLRHAETRYRTLFHTSTEAVLIVDAGTFKVIEANPAATQVLGTGTRKVVGRGFTDLFDDADAHIASDLLSQARSQPNTDPVSLRTAVGQAMFSASASLFRQEAASLFLVRLNPVSGDSGDASHKSLRVGALRVLERLPDGFVVTDPDRRILMVNDAFLDLVQLASEEQVKGQSLDRWLGRVAVDTDLLIANVREHGSVKRFATVMRGHYGAVEDIEVSGVFADASSTPCFGFSIRKINRVEMGLPSSQGLLPRSIEQMTELVGRVPLKELVRETTDIIERLCIEAALQLTDDNRASAAEILGLSRQGFYVKLRRYGLGEPQGDDAVD
jgi:transcriptional regulator PpsR